MPTIAIGDLQGCLTEFKQLLDAVQFNPQSDEVWLVGDLVARGPDSLGCLRTIRDLGTSAKVVLGNHDLHLLATAHGAHKRSKPLESGLQAILDAPDAHELLEWLRHQPLLHHDSDLKTTMVHAGLAPQWSLEQAQACAQEVETLLQGKHFVELLEQMYGDEPDQWSDSLSGIERSRFIINTFTRLRYCTPEGHYALKPKGAPLSYPNFVPWFAYPTRQSRDQQIIFGHWSTLGQVYWPEFNVYGLDTGAVWGGAMTALIIEEKQLVHVDSSGYKQPT